MMRIDQLLVQRGLASTRSQAQRLIGAGVRCRSAGVWRVIVKNGELVPPDCEIDLQGGAEARFVSRGGLKLEGALAQAGVRPAGWRCLDVGQSTGGFTDCLLQQGAAQVVGIDVGHGQLHARLRADPRVTCLEGLNARHPAELAQHPELSRESFDLLVGDLAFISQTLALPAVVPLLRPGGVLLMLVKPQFELQPGQVGRGGIVADAGLYSQVEQRIRQAHRAAGLLVSDYFASPIAGGDGNREFFVHSIRSLEVLP